MKPDQKTLLAIAAMHQAGAFEYEANALYDTKRTSGHVVRFVPAEKQNEDGSRSVGLSFPALVASDWMATPEKIMPGVALMMSHAPALASWAMVADASLEKFGPVIEAAMRWQADRMPRDEAEADLLTAITDMLCPAEKEKCDG